MKKLIIAFSVILIGLQPFVEGMQRIKTILPKRSERNPRSVAVEHAIKISRIKHEIDRKSNYAGFIAGLAGAVGMLCWVRNDFDTDDPGRSLAQIFCWTAGVASMLSLAAKFVASRFILRDEKQQAEKTRAATIAHQWAQANKDTTIRYQGTEQPLQGLGPYLHDKRNPEFRRQLGLSDNYDRYEIDAFMNIVAKMEEWKKREEHTRAQRLKRLTR